MKKYLNYTLTALALVALVACADEASSTSSGTTPTPEGGKTLIAFSQEGSAMTTRGFTRAGFTASTKVVMRIKAEGKTAADRYTQAVATASAETSADSCNTDYGLSGAHSHLTYADDDQNRYWDDAFGRDTKLTVYAVAVPNLNDDTVLPSTILDQTSPTTAPDWYTVATENTKINWSVNTTQDATTRSKEDLVYSNNIRSAETVNKGCYRQTWNGSAWAKSMQLGRMIWQSKDPSDASVTVGQFDKGHLVFKHALSWLTIVLNEGSGFNNTVNTDFAWTNKPAGSSQSFALKGFPTSGKLDLSNGEWSDVVTNVDITQLDEVSATPAAAQTTRQLEAIVLPGTNLYSTTANVIEFEIDNAKYYVSGTQIANAIRDYYKIGGTHENDTHAAEYRDFTTMKEGKRYYVNLTVSKKGIDNITAAILDWETVNSSEIKPDNVYCSFNFEDRGTRLVSTDAAKFNIYRAGKDAGAYIDDNTAANYAWETGYTTTSGTSEVANKATKSWASTTTSWTTDWYWPDNRTYYHFRAAGLGENATSTDNDVTINKATDGDYFTIKSGTLTGSDYKDYIWGAPFKDIDASAKLTYDHTGSTPYGFDGNSSHQISQAIGATNSQIKMLLFHMTSQIYITVKTTTGADKVTLKIGDDLTTVEILRFLPDGKVLMGTGAVSTTSTARTASAYFTTGTYTGESGTTPAQIANYSFGIVPQALSWGGATAGTETIGLRITTPDGNQYIVKDLSTCRATVSNTNLVIPYAGTSPYTINVWYPHYKYNYTVTLAQAGVTNITAAVLAWEEVSGDLGTITLEN